MPWATLPQSPSLYCILPGYWALSLYSSPYLHGGQLGSLGSTSLSFSKDSPLQMKLCLAG